jgi:hypothetical protein
VRVRFSALGWCGSGGLKRLPTPLSTRAADAIVSAMTNTGLIQVALAQTAEAELRRRSRTGRRARRGQGADPVR